MKKMIVYPLMAAALLMLIAAWSLRAQGLDLSIKLDKTNYGKGEPVRCTMILLNNSSGNLVVNNRFLVNFPAGPGEVSMVITGPDNHQVPFTSRVNASFQSNEFIVLPPGKSASDTYTVTNDFDLVKPGNYSLIAYYKNNDDVPAVLKLPSPWKGTIISNKINFSLSW